MSEPRVPLMEIRAVRRQVALIATAPGRMAQLPVSAPRGSTGALASTWRARRKK